MVIFLYPSFFIPPPASLYLSEEGKRGSGVILTTINTTMGTFYSPVVHHVVCKMTAPAVPSPEGWHEVPGYEEKADIFILECNKSILFCVY